MKRYATIVICCTFLFASACTAVSAENNIPAFPSDIEYPDEGSTLLAATVDTTPTTIEAHFVSEEPLSKRDITLEISRLTFAANCLRLDLLISGVQPPTDPYPGGVLRPSLVSAMFFEKGSDVPLEVALIAAGEGGGPNEGGTFDIVQETIYEPSAPFRLLGRMELTVQLVPDPSLAFDGPVLFDMAAQPDASANCGLQGLIRP